MIGRSLDFEHMFIKGVPNDGFLKNHSQLSRKIGHQSRISKHIFRIIISCYGEKGKSKF